MFEAGLIDSQSQEYADLLEYVSDRIIDNGNPNIISVEYALEEACNTFLERTHLSKIKPIHYNVILKMTQYIRNRSGSLGMESEKFGDVTASYTSDYPQEVKVRINSFRLLPTQKEQ